MKGDFTRFTFQSQKHYSGVLMQQGRVQTDADWNEQVQIFQHRYEAQVMDMLGPAGAPQDALEVEGQGQFEYYDPGTGWVVLPGRFYLGGILCENLEALPLALPGAPVEGTSYLLYLDAWIDTVTAAEDPDLLEPALGGADGGARAVVRWQVRWKVLTEAYPSTSELYDPESVDWPPEASSTGTLSLSTSQSPPDNRLYRVEVHSVNDDGSPVLKWSRDNGSDVARIEDVSESTITVNTGARDAAEMFSVGDHVEIQDEDGRVKGAVGALYLVKEIVGQVLTLDEEPTVHLDRAPTARRWNGTFDTSGTLDDWLSVTVDSTNLLLAPGDYWLIPARTTSDTPLGWDQGKAQAPHGPTHWYAPLAQATWESSKWNVDDFRPVFPTLRSLAGTGGGGWPKGSGEEGCLARWTGKSTLGASQTEEDTAGNVKVNGTLKVGSGTDVAIEEFETMLTESSDVRVPTSAAVAKYVSNAIGDIDLPTGDVSGSGTAGTLAMWSGSGDGVAKLTNSSITETSSGGSTTISVKPDGTNAVLTATEDGIAVKWSDMTSLWAGEQVDISVPVTITLSGETIFEAQSDKMKIGPYGFAKIELSDKRVYMCYEDQYLCVGDSELSMGYGSDAFFTAKLHSIVIAPEGKVKVSITSDDDDKLFAIWNGSEDIFVVGDDTVTIGSTVTSNLSVSSSAVELTSADSDNAIRLRVSPYSVEITDEYKGDSRHIFHASGGVISLGEPDISMIEIYDDVLYIKGAGTTKLRLKEKEAAIDVDGAGLSLTLNNDGLSFCTDDKEVISASNSRVELKSTTLYVENGGESVMSTSADKVVIKCQDTSVTLENDSVQISAGSSEVTVCEDYVSITFGGDEVFRADSAGVTFKAKK